MYFSLSRLHESESYFGDPKSKLPDFRHTIELVSHFHTFNIFHSHLWSGLLSSVKDFSIFFSQVETCPKEDTYANMQRQALTIRLIRL